jgi:hypothetical protein
MKDLRIYVRNVRLRKRGELLCEGESYLVVLCTDGHAWVWPSYECERE